MAKYEDELVLKDKVTNTLKKINKKFADFNKVSSKATERINNFRLATEKLKTTGRSLTEFGQKLTVGVSLPLIAAGTYASKMAMDFQDAEIALQTMLGSAEKGSKLFKDIVDLGAKTPFQSKDLLQASKLMLNFGISEKKVITYMKQLGDISGGNSERFQSLALAFSQVSSAGKLQGQDLLQMINAGFNPLQVISEKTGKSMATLRDKMSKGKISFEMVTDAMKYATSEGGRFYGMMDKMSKTASGKLSTMLDNLNIAMAKLGLVALPYITKGIEMLTKLFEKFANLTPRTQRIILVLGTLAALIGPLITGIGGLVTAIGALGTALTFLLEHPVILTIVGWTAVFAAIAAGIYNVIKAVKTLIEYLGHLRRMKIPTINLENQDNLAYLSQKQMEMGDKAFTKKYGKEVAKSVTNYRQSNVQTSNKTTNNNFYGNITTTGTGNLDFILNGGYRVPLGA